jgi:uncharacterized protein (DUF433 family)
MKLKKLFIGLAAAAVLAVGAAFFLARPAVALAMSNPSIRSILSAPFAQGAFGFFGGHGGFGRRGPQSLIDATASVTGLTVQDVMTQLQSGKSLAQIAESKGKTADDLIAAARTALQASLKQAVTDGKLTQAQADNQLQRFDASAKQIVNSTNLGGPRAGFGHGGPGTGGQAGFGLGRGGGDLVSATASVTGLTVRDVMTQLQAGKTLEQVAIGQGKTADDVIASARTTLQASLKQAVTDGKFTQAQADTVLQKFDATARQRMSATFRGGSGYGGFGHGGGELVSATASLTGLTVQDVMTQLQAGKTLEQVAVSKGKTADDVIASARSALQANLKQWVTDGKLTQTQADAELQRFDATAKQVMTTPFTGAPHGGFGHGAFGHGGFGHGGGELVSATASVTGLTMQEVMTELRGGKTLAQIAEGKGKTADDVIAAARTTLQASLKQAVTDGKLSQAQADAVLQRFDATAKQVMTSTFQHGPRFNGPGATFPGATPDTNGNSA